MSTFLFGCDNVRRKHDINELKKTSLRYFITINYSSISNEMFFGQGEYLNSLYSEVASFKKNISQDSIKEKFFSIDDPFDFAMSITKELDWYVLYF